MNKQQLIWTIIEKTEQISELEAKIKDKTGRAILLKVICNDHDSAKQFHGNLMSMVENYGDSIESCNVGIVDVSRIEN